MILPGRTPCSECDGIGSVEEYSMTFVCPQCEGLGWVDSDRNKLRDAAPRLAAALKRAEAAIGRALEYEEHIFDDVTFGELDQAQQAARAALRKAGHDDA